MKKGKMKRRHICWHKRLLGVCLTLAMVLSSLFGLPGGMGSSVETVFANYYDLPKFEPIKPKGTGTKEDPYQISKKEELYWFKDYINKPLTLDDVDLGDLQDPMTRRVPRLECHAVLTEDIVVNPMELKNADINYQNKEDYYLWEPMAPHKDDKDTNYPWTHFNAMDGYFQGSFDGQGHTISGLVVCTDEVNLPTMYVGMGMLFSTLGYRASVSNLTLENCYMNWKRSPLDEPSRCYGNYYGFICGTNYGKITNCHIKDSRLVCNANSVVGFISGVNGRYANPDNCLKDFCTPGAISYCSVTDTVKTEWAGFNGKVNKDRNVGGICARNFRNYITKEGATIENCVSMAENVPLCPSPYWFYYFLPMQGYIGFDDFNTNYDKWQLEEKFKDEKYYNYSHKSYHDMKIEDLKEMTPEQVQIDFPNNYFYNALSGLGEGAKYDENGNKIKEPEPAGSEFYVGVMPRLTPGYQCFPKTLLTCGAITWMANLYDADNPRKESGIPLGNPEGNWRQNRNYWSATRELLYPHRVYDSSSTKYILYSNCKPEKRVHYEGGYYYHYELPATFFNEKFEPDSYHFWVTTPSGLVYDGRAKSQATVTKKTTADKVYGMGNITGIHYYYTEDSENADKDLNSGVWEKVSASQLIEAGFYRVAVDITEGYNFAAADKITDKNWNVEIKKAPVTDGIIKTLKLQSPLTAAQANQTLTYWQPLSTLTIPTGWKMVSPGALRLDAGVHDVKLQYTVPEHYARNYDFAAYANQCGEGYAYDAKTRTLSATIRVTVNAKEITASNLEFTPDSAFTKIYDGTTASPAKVQIKAGVVAGTAVVVSGTAVYDSADVATASSITFTPEAIESGNYTLAATETITHAARITKKQITPLVTLDLPAEGYTYDRTRKKPQVSVTYQDEDNATQTLDAQEYTVTYSNNVDAGENTAQVTVTAKNGKNYSFTAQTLNFSIAKRQASPIATPTAFSITYGQPLSAATLSGGFSWVDGSVIPEVEHSGYAAVRSVDDVNDDYSQVDGYDEASHTVTRMVTDLTVNRAPLIIVADNKAIKPGEATPEFTYKVYGLIGTDVLPDDFVSCALTSERTDLYASETYMIQVTGAAIVSNYNVSYKSGALVVSERDMDIPALSTNPMVLTYGDTQQITYAYVDSGGTAITASGGAISYEILSGEDVIDGDAITNGTVTPLKAGVATVKIKAEQSDIYAAAETILSITVNCKAVTVTVRSESVYVGDAMPTFTADVDGLIGEDSFMPNIHCDAVDTTVAGIYLIEADGVPRSDKYVYRYVNGTFTVDDIPSAPEDDSESGGGGGGGYNGGGGGGYSGGGGGGYSGGGGGGAVVPAAPENKTETKEDGTVVTTTETKKADGTTVTKTEEARPDGTTVKKTEEAKPDGTTVTKTEEVKPDGTTVKKTEEVRPDGTAVTKTQEAKPDGTTVKKTEKKAADGSASAVTKLANEKTGESATIKVETAASGEITKATAQTTQTTEDKKQVSLAADSFTGITEAAGTKDVAVTTKLVDDKGKTVCKLTVNPTDLKPGKELVIVKYDAKTGKQTLVSADSYKVAKDGSLNLGSVKKASYQLITKKEADALSRQILKTVKAKTATKTVEDGKKTSFTFVKSLDMDNVAKITYKTSAKAVATVSENGKITAQKAGKVTVKATVTLKNGKKKTVKMVITVKK